MNGCGLNEMKFDNLRLKVKNVGVFSFIDVFKWFPQDNHQTVKNQLSGWVKKGYLLRLRKNIYYLKEVPVKDEFLLANYLYQPSYVSLESALNYYGILPDVPFSVTSITAKKPQEFKNDYGLFLYRHLKPDLYFGWQEKTLDDNQSFRIAKPEKALFDFIYLNQKTFGESFPQEERFSFTKEFSWPEFKKYASLIENNKLKKLLEKLYD